MDATTIKKLIPWLRGAKFSLLLPHLLLAASLIVVPFAYGTIHRPALRLVENFFASLPSMILVLFMGLIVFRAKWTRRSWLIRYYLGYCVTGSVQAVHQHLYGTPLLVSSIAAIAGTEITKATQFFCQFFEARVFAFITR